MVEAFALVLLASLIFLAFQLARLWSLRRAPGAIELLICTIACDLWSFGYALEILFPRLEEKLFWAKFQYIGIAILTAWLFLFILRYTGRVVSFNYQYMAALMVIPSLTILFAFTNDSHSLLWAEVALQPGWPSAPLALGHGWWFWVQIGYAYLLLVWSTSYLVRFTIRTQRLYLAQSLTMLGSLMAPWIGNAFYLLGVRPGPDLDLTPIAFTLTNVGLAFGFMRYRLLDVLPVAYPSIFQFMSDGVIVLDNLNRVVDINPAARRIFHKPDLSPPTRPTLQQTQTTDPFISRPMSRLLPTWEDHPANPSAIDEKEVRLRPGAGSDEQVYTLRTTTINNRRGHVTGKVLIFTDITRLVQAEERLRLQATALEAAENGILITNAQGEIEWANRAFTRLTGYTLAEVLGQNPRILKSGQHHNGHYKTMWDTITAGKAWRGEMVNRRKDGSLYDEEMTITPLAQPEGGVAHFIAIKQDVSDRKRAEEQLKLAHDQALESNRMKTQLLANVSHDMRTPLGAIIGYSDMLSNNLFGKLTGDQHAAVTDILDSANQLLLFINNLIGQAQFDTGKIVIKPKQFAVSELLDACRTWMHLPAARKGLALSFEIDPAVPEFLTGDPYWLRQIVLNLVNNAVKFTDQGSVKLRLYLPDAQHWAIDVADTGIGISTAAQAAIFEPFQQVDGSLTRERGGSGLGLAIVRELTSLMQGQISLVSQPGSGSTFTVCFPHQQEEFPG